MSDTHTVVPVRRAQPQDIPAMERICLATADEKLRDTEKHRENTLYLYNRYYTRAELENCFVAVDEQGRAVGYILCAENYAAYRRSFLQNECKSIAKLNWAKGIAARAEVLFMKQFSEQYPAHLHIDILPPYQGAGTGTRLMQALLAHLRKKCVPGVMLCVGAANTRAVAFYRKQGFSELQKTPGGIVFGIRL